MCDGSVSTVVELGEYGISIGGLAVDGRGKIWFSDSEGQRVRVLEPASQPRIESLPRSC